MKKIIFATAVLGLGSFAAKSHACSLAYIEEADIKAKMVEGIADYLGWTVEGVSADDITKPVLLMPLGLGADCSGLSAFHRTAGFRVKDADCIHEGSVVLHGYGTQSPVSVHAKKICSRF